MKSNVKILRMNPNIFITWIFIISISMIFVSLISAYIVKKGEPGGLIINLPDMFIYSTIVVVLSSLFKQLNTIPMLFFLNAQKTQDGHIIKKILG